MDIREALGRVKIMLDTPWPLHKDGLNGRGKYVITESEYEAIEYLYNYIAYSTDYLKESKCRIGDGVSHEYNSNNMCIWCGEESKEKGKQNP